MIDRGEVRSEILKELEKQQKLAMWAEAPMLTVH